MYIDWVEHVRWHLDTFLNIWSWDWTLKHASVEHWSRNMQRAKTSDKAGNMTCIQGSPWAQLQLPGNAAMLLVTIAFEIHTIMPYMYSMHWLLIYLSIYLSIYRSVYLYHAMYLPIYSMSMVLSICVSTSLSAIYETICIFRIYSYVSIWWGV